MAEIREKVVSRSSCVEDGEQYVTTFLIFRKRVSFAVCWDSRAPYLPSAAPSTDGDLGKFGWTISDVQGVNLLYSDVVIVESEDTTADTAKMLVLFVNHETKIFADTIVHLIKECVVWSIVEQIDLIGQETGAALLQVGRDLPPIILLDQVITCSRRPLHEVKATQLGFSPQFSTQTAPPISAVAFNSGFTCGHLTWEHFELRLMDNYCGNDLVTKEIGGYPQLRHSGQIGHIRWNLKE